VKVLKENSKSYMNVRLCMLLRFSSFICYMTKFSTIYLESASPNHVIRRVEPGQMLYPLYLPQCSIVVHVWHTDESFARKQQRIE